MIIGGFNLPALRLMLSAVLAQVMGQILESIGGIGMVSLGAMLLSAGALIEHVFPMAFLYLIGFGIGGLLAIVLACVWIILVIISHAVDLPEDDMTLPHGSE